MSADAPPRQRGCDIAIVGMACRYPDAATPQQLWEMVLARRQAFRRMPHERLRLEDYAPGAVAECDSLYPIAVAVLENYAFDRGRFRIPADTFAAVDLSHWLALEVAADALVDAGYPEARGLPHATTGVIVANTLTGEFSRASALRPRWPYVRRVLARVLKDRGVAAAEQRDLLRSVEAEFKRPFAPPNAETLAGGLANVIAGRICNYFNLGGGGYTVDGACASSLLAVTTACDRLLLGEIDVALVGAVDLSLDPFELVGFARNGALSRTEMRPYDARADGFWPGEGAGFVVLMREADARARGGPFYAAIRGYGISSDGEGGLTRPTRDGQLLALERAYEMAGVGADQVAYFEGHGTGTAVGDPVEVEAIAELRRRHGADTPAGLGSIKANIGHTKAAAGMAGLIKATMAVRRRVIPPATDIGHPHPVFGRFADQIEPARAAVWSAGRSLRAGVSGMGFGGINAHLVVEGGTGRPRAAFDDHERQALGSHQDVELFLFAAADRAGLAAEAERLHRLADALSHSELGDAAAACAHRLRSTPLRAAIVAGSAAALAERLETLLGWIAAGTVDRLDIVAGVFIGTGARMSRIGFLFPGQAAPSHLGGGLWRERFADVAELYANCELPPGGSGTDTLIAQPAIVTASLAGLGVLDRLGIVADAALGHSLGELVALHWGGMCSRDALLRLVRGRAAAMSADAEPGGQMAAVAVGTDQAAALLEGLEATVACHNTLAECVVAGSAAAIEEALRRAAARGIRATPLQVSHAFHTPHMAPAVAAFSSVLARERLSPPVRRVFSTVTGTVWPPKADPADLLCQQFVEPVRFAPVVADLAAASDLIIEVGPGQGLTRLAEAAGSPAVVALDAGGRSLCGLLTAVACAFVLGASVKPQLLFEDRFVRRFDLDRPLSFLANPCELVPDVAAEDIAATGEAAVPVAVDMAAGGAVLPDLSAMPLLDGVRQLIARRTGLPLDSIDPTARLLGDLHLNSINVAELVTRFAAELGIPSPLAPTQYANATVAEVAEAFGALRGLGDGPPAMADAHPPGVDAWAWPFVRELVVRNLPVGGERRPAAWRIIAPPDYDLRDAVARRFGHSAPADDAGLMLCLPAGLADQHLSLLLATAHELAHDPAISRLVLLQHGGGGTAYARSLFYEHQNLQVSVIDLPGGLAAGVEWAADEVEQAGPGYSEAHYDMDGVRRVGVLHPVIERTAERQLPLGADDVVVVSGGGKGIGAECALALAKETGARLGLIGRSPEDDPVLMANLARMSEAGITFCYQQADVTDAEAVRRAIGRIEDRLGQTTGLIHSAGRNEPRLAADLSLDDMRATIAAKVDGAANLLAAIDPDSLRIFIAFGSIIAPLGMRGEAHYALANEWLERLVAGFAADHPECLALTIHWSVWAGTGMGERLGSLEALAGQGVAPLTIEQGVTALTDLLRRPIPATAIVVAGRFGAPPTVDLAGPSLPLLRFVERPRVHYPGIELVVDSDISLGTDRYLREHVIGGMPVMPAVFALEAVSQAARALADCDDLPFIEEARFLRPIFVTEEGMLTIRLAGLRRTRNRIDVTIRSSTDGFTSDHVRATVRLGRRLTSPKQGALPATASTEVLSGFDPDRDLYGGLLFHTGRFKRVAGYTHIAAAGCAAEIAPAMTADWFTPYLPAELCLGDPGARDAALHALQVCVPERRVVPIAVERLAPGRVDTGTPHRIVACERAASGDTFIFDIDVFDVAGELVERWEGLTLQAIEALKPPAGWPLPLLGACFERRLATRFPHGEIQVQIERATRATGMPERRVHRPDGRPEAPGEATSRAYAQDLRLIFTARSAVGCDLETVTPRHEADWRRLLGSKIGLAFRLVAQTGDDFDAAATRVWTVSEALRKAGAAFDAPIVFESDADGGWIELRSGDFTALSVVLLVIGQVRPLAAAFVVDCRDEGS